MVPLDESLTGGPVSIRPMNNSEFDVWRRESIGAYAQDITLATGLGAQEAARRAAAQEQLWLPEGLDTTGHWLLQVLTSAGVSVGTMWIGPPPVWSTGAYLYELRIDPRRRGEGLGRAAMRLAERLAIGSGYTELTLSVFAFNGAARALCDSLGYRVVASQMSKTLGPGAR